MGLIIFVVTVIIIFVIGAVAAFAISHIGWSDLADRLEGDE